MRHFLHFLAKHVEKNLEAWYNIMLFNVTGLGFKELNEKLRGSNQPGYLVRLLWAEIYRFRYER